MSPRLLASLQPCQASGLFWNYLSIGLDAEAAYGFHTLRETHGWAASSRALNQVGSGRGRFEGRQAAWLAAWGWVPGVPRCLLGLPAWPAHETPFGAACGTTFGLLMVLRVDTVVPPLYRRHGTRGTPAPLGGSAALRWAVPACSPALICVVCVCRCLVPA